MSWLKCIQDICGFNDDCFMHLELTMQYKLEHDNKLKGVKTVKLYPESS